MKVYLRLPRFGNLSVSFTAVVLSFFLILSSGVYAAPTNVKVEFVKEEVIEDRIEALGTLRARESVVLTVNVAETITAIHFDDGDYVTKGDVLVEMTSAEESALLSEAESNALEAERQLTRIEQLVEAGTASQSLLDQRQRDYRAAKARLNATISRLKDRIVTAPFSGLVGLRNLSEGALVRPGDHITTLTDNRQMKVDFTVPAIYLSKLKKDQPVIASSVAFSGREFSGIVSSIDNQVDPVTRAITVRGIIDNSDGALRQGMLMSIDLLIRQANAIVISEGALLPSGKENFVMLAEEKEGAWVAQKRKVVIDRRRYGKVEVTEGLSLGEKLITDGAFKLSPGSVIRFTMPDQSKQTLSTLTQVQLPIATKNK